MPIHEKENVIRFMMIVNIALYLFLTAMTSLGMVAMPASGGANEISEINRVNQINSERQNYYLKGRVDRLEQEVNGLETGLVIIAILTGSTFSSLFVLAARDRINKLGVSLKSGSERATNEPQQRSIDPSA